MSIHACRECGNGVSSEAASCPHCGVPHPAWMVSEESAGGESHQEVAAWTGVLYIGTNGHVAAVHPEHGEEIWRTKLGNWRSGPGQEDVCVIEHYGRVFAGCQGFLFCLDAHTGQVLWRNELKGLGHNDVALAIGGQSIQYVTSAASAGVGEQVGEKVTEEIVGRFIKR